MRPLHPYLRLLALAVLSACKAEDLSVGMVACENVRCEPPPYVDLSSNSAQMEVHQHSEAVEVRAVPLPLPCAEDLCNSAEGALLMLEDEGESEALVAWHAFDEQRIWIGRYSDMALEWEATLHSTGSGEHLTHSPLTIHLLPGDEPGSALALVSSLERSWDDYMLSAYAIDRDGGVERLFEDRTSSWIVAADRLGDDVVALSRATVPFFAPMDRERGDHWPQHIVTRYTQRGAIAWRQAKLADFERSTLDALPSAAGMRVLADDAIAVLFPAGWFHGISVLEPNGDVRWTTHTQQNHDPSLTHVNGAITANAEGEPIVALDGFSVMRMSSAVDDVAHAKTGHIEREELYVRSVFGLDVDAAGAVYIASQDGDASHRRQVIDRVNEPLDRVDSVELDLPLEDDGACANVMRAFTRFEVSADGERAYIVADGCFIEVPLPPPAD